MAYKIIEMTLDLEESNAVSEADLDLLNPTFGSKEEAAEYIEKSLFEYNRQNWEDLQGEEYGPETSLDKFGDSLFVITNMSDGYDCYITKYKIVKI